MNTPLKFTEAGRWSAWAVAKSAKAQMWVPTTKGRCPATVSRRSISSAWYSSVHIAGGSAWLPGSASAPNSVSTTGLPYRS